MMLKYSILFPYFSCFPIQALFNTNYKYKKPDLDPFFIHLIWNPNKGITIKEVAYRDSSWLNFEHIKSISNKCISLASSYCINFGPIRGYQWNHVSPCVMDFMAIENSIHIVLLVTHNPFVCINPVHSCNAIHLLLSFFWNLG